MRITATRERFRAMSTRFTANLPEVLAVAGAGAVITGAACVAAALGWAVAGCLSITGGWLVAANRAAGTKGR